MVLSLLLLIIVEPYGFFFFTLVLGEYSFVAFYFVEVLQIRCFFVLLLCSSATLLSLQILKNVLKLMDKILDTRQ